MGPSKQERDMQSLNVADLDSFASTGSFVPVSHEDHHIQIEEGAPRHRVGDQKRTICARGLARCDQ
jgi:hypothetical protein